MHVRLSRRSRWPTIIPLYNVRECPDCAALVCGDDGQRLHAQGHENTRRYLFGSESERDGYTVGSGPLPEEVIRGEEQETAQ